jgi:hypothetical protein
MGGGPPPKIKVPERDYGTETRETLQAQLDLAPQMLEAEQKYGPQYQQMQIDMLKSAMPQLVDLYKGVATPLGEMDAANKRAQQEADIAAVRDLGPEALAAMKASNPQMAQLIESMTQQAQAGLDAGSALTPQQQMQAQQASRQAWAARGLGASPAAGLDEVVTEQMMGAGEQDRRRGFAMQAAGMEQGAYGNPFQAILSRPVGTAAMMGVLGGQSMGMQPGRVFNPESQYGADVFGSNAQGQLAANTANAANKAAWSTAKLNFLTGPDSV